MDGTTLAYCVAGRAVAAFLQGGRLTSVVADAGRPPWQQVVYEPPASVETRMFVRGPDGAMRPTTDEEQRADARRQVLRARAVVVAAGPVALALRDRTPAQEGRPAGEERWFDPLALEMEPDAAPERIAELYRRAAAQARRLLEKPKSWSAVEEVARALAAAGRLKGAEAVGAILTGRGGRTATPAIGGTQPLSTYRARLRRGG